MNSPRMIYREGNIKIHGYMVETKVIEAEDYDEYYNKGWRSSPAETVDNTGPTRAELEEKANELGIKFRSNTKDSTIASKIEAALNELD